MFEEITGRSQSLTADEVTSLRGKTLRQILKYLKIRPWQVPRLVLKTKRLMSSKMNSIRPIEGLPAVLKTLNEHGLQMVILSSNSSTNINNFLKAEGLDKYFSKVYGDIGLRGKASVLRKILKNEGFNRDSCAYIGDETRDIEAAQKANLTSVGVGWGYNLPTAIKRAKPDIYAAQPKDLLKIIDK